jgi:hypothetical protein
MGLRVTAAQAAWLTGHGERMVRWHIQTRKDLPAVKDGRSWAIDVDALEAIPGWRVNRERLAELETADARTAASMAARLAELERIVRELRSRLARLEAHGGASGSSASDASHTSAPEDRQTVLGHTGGIGTYPHSPKPSDSPLSAFGDVLPDLGVSRPTYPAYRGPRTVTLADRGPGAPLRFRTKTDAARWLGRHGINEATPKTWRGWPPDELTPAAALAFALDLQRDARARGDWRVSWTLRRCTDEACVCRELLTE